MEELFKFLENKLIDTTDTSKLNDFKEYFKAFFQEYQQNNLDIIGEISNLKIMTPLIILSNPLKTKEIIATIEKYSYLFDNKNLNLIPLFHLYYQKESFKDIVDKCISPNPLIYIPALTKYTQALIDNDLVSLNSDIISFFQKNPQAKKDLEVLFINFNNNLYNYGLGFMKERDKYNDSYENNNASSFLSFLPRAEKRMSQKILNIKNQAQTRFKEMIQRYFGFLHTTYNSVLNDYKKSERVKFNHNKNIEELKKLLDTKEEITDIDTILKLCKDEEIKKVVVDFIIKHNRKIYNALIINYEKAKYNSDKNLNALFTKCGFDYDNLTMAEKNQIKELDYDTIEEILKKLNNLQITRVNIAKVSLYKLTKVEELITKGLINIEWLKANESLLYSDNEYLEQAITNIDILSSEGINMIQYQNSLDITISPLVSQNLQLLRKYKLEITRSTTNMNFLATNDLRERIEFVYSLGLYSELNDLNILNNSLEGLLRIKIASILNISVIDIKDDLEEIFFDFSNTIIPYKIKIKLAQESNYISELPKYLENYKIDHETLSINGVYVSIKKIKRNLAKLKNNNPESCFYAIIYNGYYTYDEIEVLKNTLIPIPTLSKSLK